MTFQNPLTPSSLIIISKIGPPPHGYLTDKSNEKDAQNLLYPVMAPKVLSTHDTNHKNY